MNLGRTAETQRYFVITLTLFTGIIALAISTAALSLNSTAVAQPAPEGLRGHSYQDPMQEISLTLNASGFSPAEVRPQSGRFLLSIDNRSGASDLVFRLTRADGTLVREFRMLGAGGDLSEAFDLAQSTYRLNETNHSSWTCTIIVR